MLPSTSGYGNITPRTTGGQALSMFYALFGIPLVFAILSQFGKTLTQWLSAAWVQYRRWMRKRLRNNDKKKRRESRLPKKEEETRKWSYASRDQVTWWVEEGEVGLILWSTTMAAPQAGKGGSQ